MGTRLPGYALPSGESSFEYSRSDECVMASQHFRIRRAWLPGTARAGTAGGARLTWGGAYSRTSRRSWGKTFDTLARR